MQTKVIICSGIMVFAALSGVTPCTAQADCDGYRAKVESCIDKGDLQCALTNLRSLKSLCYRDPSQPGKAELEMKIEQLTGYDTIWREKGVVYVREKGKKGKHKVDENFKPIARKKPVPQDTTVAAEKPNPANDERILPDYLEQSECSNDVQALDDGRLLVISVSHRRHFIVKREGDRYRVLKEARDGEVYAGIGNHVKYTIDNSKIRKIEIPVRHEATPVSEKVDIGKLYKDNEHSRFNEGFAIVKVRGKWSLIDDEGNVFSTMYEPQNTFYDGFAVVKYNNKFAFMDKYGKILHNKWYEEAHTFDVLLHRALVRVGSSYGFIDVNGGQVIPARYEWAGDFAEGLAAVELRGKWGFIDINGTPVIKPQYGDAYRFAEGLAAVKVSTIGKWGFINSEGRMVIPARFDDGGGVMIFSNGRARVRVGEDMIVIDKSGAPVGYAEP